MNTSHWHRAPAAAAAAALLAGCSTPAFFSKPTSLADEWSRQMVQFRISPVFPPGEDIQIGDVFVACSGGAEAESVGFVPGVLAAPIRLARTEQVGPALEAYYKGSVQMLRDETRKGLEPKPGFVKLRNLSLPEFFQVRASGAQLSGLLPLGTTLAGFGLSAEDVDSVDVSITSAGSASLPMLTMAAALGTLEMNHDTVNDAVAQYQKEVCKTASTAKVLVVNEIYAAYSIALSVNVKSSRAAAASVALTLPSDSTRKAAFEALSAYFKAPPSAAAPAASAPAAAAAGPAAAASAPAVNQAERDKLFVASLQSMLSGTQDAYRMDHPGVSVGVYQGTQAGIRMDRQFVEPVVIGFRHLELRPGAKAGSWAVLPSTAPVAPLSPAPKLSAVSAPRR